MYQRYKKQIGYCGLLVGVLLSGCQQSSVGVVSEEANNQTTHRLSSTGETTKNFVDYLKNIQVPSLQTRSTVYKDFFNSTAPSLIALVDGETLHLNGQYIGWKIPDIVSYRWSDMDGNILSENSQLDRTLYYDAEYDFENKGYIEYSKTIHVSNSTGKSASKRFDVHVYAKPFPRGRVFGYGPLAGAYFTLYHFGQSEVIADGVTIFGKWGDLNSSGWLNLDSELVQALDTGYYTLQVAFGADVDHNYDSIWDDVPATVRHPFHTIVWQSDLEEGGYYVTLLGEIYYQAYENYRQDVAGSETSLRQLFDNSAKEVLKEDIDGDGDIDYADILRWNPAHDMDKLNNEFKEEINNLGQWLFATKEPV